MNIQQYEKVVETFARHDPALAKEFTMAVPSHTTDLIPRVNSFLRRQVAFKLPSSLASDLQIRLDDDAAFPYWLRDIRFVAKHFDS